MSREERRIQRIVELCKKQKALPIAGLHSSVGVEAQDDCAVIPFPGGTDLVIGSDFVRGEGFHLFRQGLLTREDIGFYLIGANASDLAAMGAAPLGVTVVYRYAECTTDNEFEEVFEGIALACRQFSLPLIGGDTGSYELPVLAATAFGTCPHGKALLRTNGKPGDRLFVTGDVGLAAAALAYFTSKQKDLLKLTNDDRATLLKPWKRVEPALLQGIHLVHENLSKAAIDTSDGLKTACRHLASASQVDIVIDIHQLPVSPIVRRVADALEIDVTTLTCGDSVDFRLLFTAPKENAARIHDDFTARGWPIHEIGELRRPISAPRVLLQNGSTLSELPGNEKNQ